jgi:hypothetical protein
VCVCVCVCVCVSVCVCVVVAAAAGGGGDGDVSDYGAAVGEAQEDKVVLGLVVLKIMSGGARRVQWYIHHVGAKRGRSPTCDGGK